MIRDDISPMPALVIAAEMETLHPPCKSAAVCWVMFHVGSISSTSCCPGLVFVCSSHFKTDPSLIHGQYLCVFKYE